MKQRTAVQTCLFLTVCLSSMALSNTDDLPGTPLVDGIHLEILDQPEPDETDLAEHPMLVAEGQCCVLIRAHAAYLDERGLHIGDIDIPQPVWIFPRCNLNQRALELGVRNAHLNETRNLYIPLERWDWPQGTEHPENAACLLVQMNIEDIRPGLGIDITQQGDLEQQPASPEDTLTCELAFFSAPSREEAENRLRPPEPEPVEVEAPESQPPEWRQIPGSPLLLSADRENLIPGLRAGIRNMHPGEERILLIPPQMAYEQDGLGGDIIPPDHWLIMRVQCTGLTRQNTSHQHSRSPR